MSAFTNHVVVDHCYWTGKIIGQAYPSCNRAVGRITLPKINIYAHNSSFDNQVMNLNASFGKCFRFWKTDEVENENEEVENENEEEVENEKNKKKWIWKLKTLMISIVR